MSLFQQSKTKIATTTELGMSLYQQSEDIE